MVRPLLDHPDQRVRQVAAWWLGGAGLQNDLYETMNARLTGSDPIAAPQRRRRAGQPAHAPGHPAAGRAGGRRVARSAGARRGGARAGPHRRHRRPARPGQGLAAGDATVRAAAWPACASCASFQDPSLAVPLLSDADEDVRAQAIYTIGATRSKALVSAGGEEAVRGAGRAGDGDPSARVRKKAAWALGEIGAPVGLAGPALSQAASKDSDPLVRSLAAASQGKLAR
jgi:HEAT repeat protein